MTLSIMAEHCYAECQFYLVTLMKSVVMLNVIMLNVIMLSVMAPIRHRFMKSQNLS
jgi:hypothetical protein